MSELAQPEIVAPERLPDSRCEARVEVHTGSGAVEIVVLRLFDRAQPPVRAYNLLSSVGHANIRSFTLDRFRQPTESGIAAVYVEAVDTRETDPPEVKRDPGRGPQ